MISNLPKGLSRRVVQAVTDRLRRAMAGGDDIQSAAALATLTAEDAGAAPEAAGGAGPDAVVEVLGTDVPPRDRSRSPRRVEISEELRNQLTKELKDEMVRDFLEKLPAISEDE